MIPWALQFYAVVVALMNITKSARDRHTINANTVMIYSSISLKVVCKTSLSADLFGVTLQTKTRIIRFQAIQEATD